jgi:hypothetical protein
MATASAEPSMAAPNVLHRFVQATPGTGAAPTLRTEAQLAHDGRTLFVALRAEQPAGVSARTLRRDDDAIDSDDHLTLVLDPQGTQRHGYLFRVNPLGARRDGIVFDGASVNWQWDATWAAAVHASDDGWSAELAIPLALVAAPAGSAPWRFNVERFVAATGERMRLYGAVAERGVESLPDAGVLTGLQPERSGWGLRLQPGVRWQRSVQGDGSSQQALQPFADASWQVRPGITTTAALNADFADAAPDDREVNLSRFELFRPDRRRFFTQDSGRFAFGGLEGEEPELVAFFSRRIGLDRTLDAGLKVAGTAGPVDFGVLATQVEKGRAAPNDERTRAPRALVMRASLPIGEQQHVGVIGTRGNPEGTGGVQSSRLDGIDHRWRSDAVFGDRVAESWLWSMRSRNDGLGAGSAHGLQLAYPNLGWNGTLAYKRIDERFLPALGFLEEAGIEDVGVEWGWWHRRADGGELRPRLYAGRRQRLDGSERSHYLGPALEWSNAVGDTVIGEAYVERERIAQDFEPLPGLSVAAGSYRFASAAATVETSAARALSMSLYGRIGGWYAGRLAEQSVEVSWRPSAHWAVAGAVSRQSARISGARFTARTVELSLEHAASTHSAQSVVLQYDNISRRTLAALRARWEIAPGTEWRVSIDRAWPVREADERRSVASIVFATEWSR